MESMIEIFEKLEDMRDNRGKKHKLIDIIVMSIYAIICGEIDFENRVKPRKQHPKADPASQEAYKKIYDKIVIK